MSERQIHGFLFENKIINKLGLIASGGYTFKYDAYDELNTPYQIKYIKKGSSIDLGDIFRNAKKDKDFYLIVGFWQGNKDNTTEIHKLFIQKDKWNKGLEFERYEEMKKWIKNVSNDRSFDLQWKKEMKFWKEEFNRKKRNIAIRFKRDHGNQKRIQCAINNSIFKNYFLKEYENEQIWF